MDANGFNRLLAEKEGNLIAYFVKPDQVGKKFIIVQYGWFQTRWGLCEITEVIREELDLAPPYEDIECSWISSEEKGDHIRYKFYFNLLWSQFGEPLSPAQEPGCFYRAFGVI